MKKITLQALVLIAIFFSVLFSLKQINWMGALKIEKNTEKLSGKLGEFYWRILGGKDTEIQHKDIRKGIDSLLHQICKNNNIDSKTIQVHVLEKDEVNAFALPGRRLVIYSGLINEAKNQDELAGVMAHELAHIELNHVMKKLISEVGLTTLISMTTGGGSENIKSLIKTSYDRSLEKEADIKAVDYLTEASINPEPFANFLFRLSTGETSNAKMMSWLSTHPDSEERGLYIIEHCKDHKKEYHQVITEENWKKMQKIVSKDSTP